MRKAIIICILVVLVALPALAFVHGIRGRVVSIDKYDTIDRPARIYPDYSSTVIPPKIAPLNFMVQEKGLSYLAKIYSEKGEAIEVSSRSGKILISENSWHKLLETNRGGELHFDIFVRTENGKWNRFSTITSKIANEETDNFLVYRRMHPTFTLTRGRLGIYQRDLRSFDEKVVLDNRSHKINCVNCHTFCENRPDKALISVRTKKEGDITLLIEHGKVNKLNTKFGYTSWHPSGKMAVYSVNNLPMFFHTAQKDIRDTVDMDSALVYYDTDSKTVEMPAQISRKEFLETWPAWSADGRFLYFCQTPLTWKDKKKVPPDGYDKVKYNLVRISYDVENDKWGEVETVLSAQDTGRSIAMPRTSPDGRWLIFCMCDYGTFPPWQKNSDLYIIDLKSAEKTGKFEYKRMDISSDQSEGWHSWSSNGRWIVFSSKREHGVFTRSYISYIDENGNVSKPLVVPQKDPEFYTSCLDTFNTPEFVTGPVLAAGEQLARAVQSSGDRVEMPMAITMATPKVEGVPEKGRE